MIVKKAIVSQVKLFLKLDLDTNTQQMTGTTK